jgi:hypothetical protein
MSITRGADGLGSLRSSSDFRTPPRPYGLGGVFVDDWN